MLTKLEERLTLYSHNMLNRVENFKVIYLKKLDQGALSMSDPCGTLPLWPLNPMQCPGLTVSFPTFTFVLIDLLSLVK